MIEQRLPPAMLEIIAKGWKRYCPFEQVEGNRKPKRKPNKVHTCLHLSPRSPTKMLGKTEMWSLNGDITIIALETQNKGGITGTLHHTSRYL